MAITTVIKRSGEKEPFSPDKLNKWAQYVTKTGGDWSRVALDTASRLTEVCHSKDIHETMIRVCLDMEQLEYSRGAARLEFATLRKNLAYLLSTRDDDDFITIWANMIESGLWCEDTLPTYNERFNTWYQELRSIKLEFWQIKQWGDKYSLKLDDLAVETPAMGILALYLAIHGDSQLAFDCAKDVLLGKTNLPTPVLNGCRNGDFDSISCCVIKGGDTVDSIGVAEHISYKMTAKKAGIGITFETRSHGDSVKKGRVKHLGKHGIYSTVCEAVKMFTQVGRGGSATMTYAAHDPEIEKMLLWKTQSIDIEMRIDKMDYSFAYNDAFVEAVIKDGKWALWSIANAPELLKHSFYHDNAEDYNEILQESIEGGLSVKWLQARDLLKVFLTSRQETGRIYAINVTRTNQHTPFIDTIYQSNLCQEIALPTKPYKDMFDLYASEESEGETAFCSLSALNVGKIGEDEYELVAERTLRTVDKLIDLAPMMTPSMEESIRRRRSVGIGITGLANYLYARGLDYDGSVASLTAVSELSEKHYYFLLKASQLLAKESSVEVLGVNLKWLPIDTRINTWYNLSIPVDKWNELRGVPRKHSVLVAHMPTENSAVFSDAINGLYPARRKVINKSSRTGLIQYIAPKGDYLLAWECDNGNLAKTYSVVQDFTDQAISADYFVNFQLYPNGKLPMSQLMKEFVRQYKLGNKTMYYTNSNTYTGGSFQDTVRAKEVEEKPLAKFFSQEVEQPKGIYVEADDDSGCESGGCKL